MCAKRGFSTTPGDSSAMPGEWSATSGERCATPGERSATPSQRSAAPGELSVFAGAFRQLASLIRPLATPIRPFASLIRPATSLLAILLVTAQLTGCTAIRLVADLANIYKDDDEAASERVLAPVITPPRARDADREAARDADRDAARDADRDAARDAQRDSARDTARKGAPRAAREEVKASPVYKIGEPYSVNGNWYYPKRDLTYDETGIASWYGEEFAGRLTANGEIFEPGIVSAAHQTLPMPSIVRVTNLENGRSLVVRVNDRGPFVRGRIIDLSREAARLLEFQSAGHGESQGAAFGRADDPHRETRKAWTLSKSEHDHQKRSQTRIHRGRHTRHHFQRGFKHRQVKLHKRAWTVGHRSSRKQAACRRRSRHPCREHEHMDPGRRVPQRETAPASFSPGSTALAPARSPAHSGTARRCTGCASDRSRTWRWRTTFLEGVVDLGFQGARIIVE